MPPWGWYPRRNIFTMEPDPLFDATYDLLAKTRTDLTVLRKAVRALAGLDHGTLGSLTVQTMQTVCTRRGWIRVGVQPWPGDPGKVAFEIYDNAKATCGETISCVMIPQAPTAGDYARRVWEWVFALATRHGDVAPAEILAEALAVQSEVPL